MHRLRFVPVALVSILATVVAAPASAAPITIGSPLTAPFGVSACNADCTVVSTGFNEPGAIAKAPIDGTIVRWHIMGGAPGFGYRLRVASESPGALDPNFTGSGASAPASANGPGLQTFSASLPIKAGQLIGLDLPADAPIGYLEVGSAGDSYAFFEPFLGEGQTQESQLDPGELAFNAEIQPPPAVTAISPPSGSFKGGTVVTIAGSDLTGASAVTFGTVPAQSFSVASESQITAVAPALPGPGSAAVSVTTPPGTATSAVGFQAQACKVPQLKGKKLKGAKKRSRRARCKVGKVKKIEGATAKTGRVVKQRPKPGKVLAPGAKIKLTLSP
jgi:hypothetical protein